MSITIRRLTKDKARQIFSSAKVINRIPTELLKEMRSIGWKVVYDYSIEKEYQGYYIVIEFCIGDYCVSICSKKGHWLLEAKQSAENFAGALIAVAKLENRIDEGEHWIGEED